VDLNSNAELGLLELRLHLESQPRSAESQPSHSGSPFPWPSLDVCLPLRTQYSRLRPQRDSTTSLLDVYLNYLLA
jgi:hypothetical protein